MPIAASSTSWPARRHSRGRCTGGLYATPGEFADSVEETGRQLAEAMRRSGTPDLIILPCCDQVSAMALARQLRRSWSRPRPRILLWLLYGPHHLEDTGRSRGGRPGRRSARRLRRARGQRRRHRGLLRDPGDGRLLSRPRAVRGRRHAGPGTARARPRRQGGRRAAGRLLHRLRQSGQRLSPAAAGHAACPRPSSRRRGS